MSADDAGKTSDIVGAREKPAAKAGGRSLEQDVDTLRQDLAKIRDDLASLSRTLAGKVSETAEAGAETLSEAVDHARARTQAFAEEARLRGEEGVAALEGKIRANPLSSILIAFIGGYVFGRLTGR
jgi:ElaB/YqjD/DUF883 family membrane-anchored ribosome-binding protein